MQPKHSVIAAAAFVTVFASASARAADRVEGNLIQFNSNGAWSWFEDERAIVDPAAGRILVSSVADASGQGGATRNGDIDLAHFDLATGSRGIFVLKDDYVADDHNSAALWRRPDGRYLAVYAGHFTDDYSYYRLSETPGDATTWGPEQRFDNEARATYSNLYYLPNDNDGQGRLYNFTRTHNWDPNILVSGDEGSTWSYGGKVVTQGADGDRPYARYYSDGQRIHVTITEEHPRDFDNGIYHGYIQDGALYGSTGEVVDDNLFDKDGQPVPQLTPVFSTGTAIGGAAMRHAWTTDVAVDAEGRPVTVFTARADGDNTDHRFLYAAFDGTDWSVNELARAGGFLYRSEGDYTGLAAIDPDDTNTVYISTRIDPRDGQTTSHYEIYKGTTSNTGADWQWQAVTEDSTVDNLRPIVPKWDDANTALLWLRGDYRTYTDYDLAVVGLVDREGITPGVATYVDADASNTARAGGDGNWHSTGDRNMGAADDLWHQRSGFGNNGQVFTADEVGAEDAPLLVTTASDLEAGTYDVWVYFWSNTAEAWQIEAGLAPDAMLEFKKQSGQHALLEELDGAESVEFVSGDNGEHQHALYRAYLGRSEIDESGRLNVYVDDGEGTHSSTRTWYDGIGYAPVPEPGAAGIGMISFSLLLKRS